MATISYSWSNDDLTPQLLAAVGKVVLHWSMLEDRIIRNATPYAWKLQKPVPSKVSDILKLLKKEADNLYPRHPQMPGKFESFCGRLLETQALRNDVSHGIPAHITISGVKFYGLVIPPQGKKDQRYREMSVEQIESVANQIIQDGIKFDRWSDELFRAEQRISRSQKETRNGKWMFTADIFPEPDPSL